MIIDKQLVLSDAQVITNASAASTSYIDSLAAGDAISPGARIKISSIAAFTIAGSTPTLTCALQCDDNDSFSSPKTLIATSALLAAALTIGAVLIDATVPLGCERYIRAYYTLAGGTFALGNLDARIVLDTDKTQDRLL